MTETQLFVSSCTKREMARRRTHSRYAAALSRASYSAITLCAFVLVCGGAFVAGRGGI